MTEKQKTLKKLMIDADLNSPSDLARQVGVSQPFLWYLLNGERESRKIRARVSRILRISEAELTVLIGP